jgi:polyisoprenoid-binding protein YceI
MSTQTQTSTQSELVKDLTGEYRIDPGHSRLGFVARHAMIAKVRGHFGDVDGTLQIDADDPTRSSASVRVAVASVSTGDAQRDGHLRSPDFFDVDTYPELTFTSTRIDQVDDETFRVHGDLTIRGITKPVTIDVEHTGVALDPFGNLRAGFEGKAEVNRKEWGLTWNAALETGGLLISEKIKLELDISAIKTA